MLPNFLIIGAMKAGTTSLYRYLQAHPDAFLSTPKELNFFVEERNWPRGREWYESHFASDEARGAKARGEASTTYTFYPHYDGVAARISALLPEVRLVYLVREPIARMRSNWVHGVQMGAERTPFAAAVTQDERYLDGSRYGTQLDQYLAHFDRDQIVVVDSDKLRDETHATLTEVAAFLGLDPAAIPEQLDMPSNVSAARRTRRPAIAALRRLRVVDAARRVTPQSVRDRLTSLTTTGALPSADLPAATERALREALRPEVERLRQLTGLPLAGWGGF